MTTSEYLEPERVAVLADDSMRVANQAHAAAVNAADMARQTLAEYQRLFVEVQALAARPAPSSRLPESVMAVFRVVALVLAVRLMLVMALVGTFALALIAMDKATALHTATVIAFAVLTLGPLVFLEVRNRPAPPAQPAE